MESSDAMRDERYVLNRLPGLALSSNINGLTNIDGMYPHSYPGEAAGNISSDDDSESDEEGEETGKVKKKAEKAKWTDAEVMNDA